MISSDTIEYEGHNAQFALLENKHFNQGKTLRACGIAGQAHLFKNLGWESVLLTTRELNLKVNETQKQFVARREQQIKQRAITRHKQRANQKKLKIEKRKQNKIAQNDNSYKSGAYEGR